MAWAVHVYCCFCFLSALEKMEPAVMNLHNLFENLRAQVDILNENIEPRK